MSQQAYSGVLGSRRPGAEPRGIDAGRESELHLLHGQLDPHLRRLPVILEVVRRSRAPASQIIAYIHARLGWLVLLYCPSAREASATGRLLKRVGIRAGAAKRDTTDFDATVLDVLVGVAGSPIRSARGDIRLVAHVAPPESLEAYAADVAPIAQMDQRSAWPHCVIFHGFDRAAAPYDVNAYCIRSACRHLVLSGLRLPDGTLPQPREFNCRHCDICLSEPRACYGDQPYPPFL